jgi:hypothetical protein
MAHRLTNAVFALFVATMLPIGFALAQGGGADGGGAGVGSGAGAAGGGASSPPITGQSAPPSAPVAAQGVAEQPAGSPTGLAKTSADGTSTIIVPARPCSTAARETDGTTTCVGIPAKR